MCIAGIAINATMLTTLIGVHAVPHAHIRTVYLIHYTLSMIFEVDGCRIGFRPVVNAFNLIAYLLVLQETVLRVDCAPGFLDIGRRLMLPYPPAVPLRVGREDIVVFEYVTSMSVYLPGRLTPNPSLLRIEGV